ncbi:MAG: 50S ribosomal protein L21 [Rickettsiales bacterium]|jgi:large subunit ribosomal protein L21|nr:50S ribosomal protein L21 [Rickettsiales bacterium]
MFAVLRTGNKQYTVSEGNFIDVEKLDAEEGGKVLFGDILLVEDAEGRVLVGKPKVVGVTVEAEVIKNHRDKKVMIFKMRRRKNSRTMGGHRQSKTRVRITSIVFSNYPGEA